MTAGPEGSRETHRFGLDLLRAAAVLMVVSSHGGMIGTRWFGVVDPPLCAVSGFFGVEAFFVLSGFLIGRIILATIAADPRGPVLRTFLVRRWARTLPLYYVLVAVLFVFLPPAGPAGGIVPYFLTLTQNLAWKTRGFWFPVTWSLAVEEWFYVLFPLVVLALARRRGAAAGMARATVLFLVVPLVLRALLPRGIDWNDVTRQVVVLRLDAIAFGVGACLLDASRLGPRLRRRRVPLALAGVVLLVTQWWGGLQGTGRLATWLHDVFATDIADGGWALTILLFDGMGRPIRSIAVPVRLVAERSYGLYLTHLTVLGIADRGIVVDGWNRPITAAAVLAAFVVVPSVTWRYLERPILSRARRSVPVRPVPSGAHRPHGPRSPRDADVRDDIRPRPSYGRADGIGRTPEDVN